MTFDKWMLHFTAHVEPSEHDAMPFLRPCNWTALIHCDEMRRSRIYRHAWPIFTPRDFEDFAKFIAKWAGDDMSECPVLGEKMEQSAVILTVKMEKPFDSKLDVAINPPHDFYVPLPPV